MGRSVLPFVLPMVIYREAKNLCMFSVTSLLITSGQPSWFSIVVTRGKYTSCVRLSKCSRGLPVKSPDWQVVLTFFSSSGSLPLQKKRDFFLTSDTFGAALDATKSSLAFSIMNRAAGSLEEMKSSMMVLDSSLDHSAASFSDLGLRDELILAER